MEVSGGARAQAKSLQPLLFDTAPMLLESQAAGHALAPKPKGRYMKFTIELIIVLMDAEPGLNPSAIACSLNGRAEDHKMSPRQVRRLIAKMTADGLLYNRRIVTDAGFAYLRESVRSMGMGGHFVPGGLPLFDNSNRVDHQGQNVRPEVAELLRDMRIAVGQLRRMGIRSPVMSRILRFAPVNPKLISKIVQEAGGSRKRNPIGWAVWRLGQLTSDPGETGRKTAIAALMRARHVPEETIAVWREATKEKSGDHAYHAACAIMKACRRFRSVTGSDARSIIDWCDARDGLG